MKAEIELTANDSINIGQLAVSWAEGRSPSPVSFKFVREKDGVVVNLSSFSMPAIEARKLAIFILENI